ncbi:DUF4325 domain-containing protein [Cryobacterium sp. TMT2-15-1]|uniref:STAS-like domain-containing protein n=1 Tax=Cryobacterium sp. TMT2-15-1 TaxID=1259246 RepID=UPI00106A9EA4|nr:DUF4325 domain-containing protein [Cryobacterium sp. TMT2-15-1]TFC56881.1 DUF4325 domain-containing protein [Cryobacterium sp. TMT2-15-1]
MIQYKVPALRGHDYVDDLIRSSRGWDPEEPVQIELGHGSVYPNGAVPFAAAIDTMREAGKTFTAPNLPAEKERLGVIDPMTVDRYVRYETALTNVVWKYRNEDEAHQLTSKYMDALTDKVACEAGVIDALNWCIYEVLDNVFQHSKAPAGYVMMQLHDQSRKCVIAVSDMGVGVQQSLVRASAESHIDPSQLREAHLAIAHAAQAGVTSKGRMNQGNGLFGLRRAIEINGGSLSIRSGRGLWMSKAGVVTASSDLNRPVLDPDRHQSTTVDWQLDCATPVSINEALGRTDRGSELLEEIEVGPGHYRIDAAEIEDSIGSRVKGSEVRVRIQNYLSAGAKQIVVDLTQVGVVSSSFADEVLGKLALEMGELEYRRRIFIDGASVTNRGLIEKAIELRLASGG